MILKAYRSDHPGSLLLLPLIVVCLWLAGFLEGSPPPSYQGTPLYEGIASLFRTYPWTGWTAGALLAILGSLLSIGIARDLNFPEEHGNLPPLLYPLLIGLFPGGQWAHPTAFALPFLMISFWRLVKVQKGGTPTPYLFDAGLSLGVAGLFHIPFLLFFPFLWVAAVILRSIGWRDLFWSLAGLGLPFLFLAVYQYWYDRLHLFPKLFDEAGSAPFLYTEHSLWLSYGLWGILALLFLSGVFITFKEAQHSNMQGKKLRWIFFLMLAFGGGTYLLGTRYFADPLIWTIIAFPFSFLLTAFFSRKGPQHLSAFIFYIWLLLLLLNHFLSSYF